MKLSTKFFEKIFKFLYLNDTAYETFFVLLSLKSKIILRYQQKNVEKIL